MRMDRERPAPGPLVRGFGAGGYRVDAPDGTMGVYPALLLTATRADSWTPPALEALDEEVLAPLLGTPVEFVLLGTGATLRRAPKALVTALDSRGIGVEAMDSRAAARAWGVLRAEERQIAAALYPLDY
ncbi:Mth938-like domain-containing protein [Sphingomonas sp. RHCKR7]|uniref:Mth938-like domain-containing protein n=1 Tax=Sphingomonas folli TaxID=2862497 RepID=UPI001C7188A3|nr:Mth938-like domain-containing protein [Sphingomonas folli]MBW6526084.1 Mth938-like domain-containing protein [Sphingomonas folli]